MNIFDKMPNPSGPGRGSISVGLSDLGPTAAAAPAGPMETGADHQPTDLIKVLPAGGPVLGGGRCPSCLYTPEQAREDPFHGCPVCDGRETAP